MSLNKTYKSSTRKGERGKPKKGRNEKCPQKQKSHLEKRGKV